MTIGYRIYQLPSGIDYKFHWWDELKNMDASPKDYSLVYKNNKEKIINISSSEIQKDIKEILDELYQQFNTDRPLDYSGHRMSVSDVVVLNIMGIHYAYYCDAFGWREWKEFWDRR